MLDIPEEITQSADEYSEISDEKRYSKCKSTFYTKYVLYTAIGT